MEAAATEQVRVLTQGKAYMAGDAGILPTMEESSWQPVTLPDLWQKKHRDYGGNIWYRLSVSLTHAPRALWSVYLPRVSMNAAVYVNGVIVGSGGRFEQPVARNWNRPLYFTVPEHLWHAGRNTILVRVYADKNCRGALYPLKIGPDVLLQPEYQHSLFWQIDVLSVLAILSMCAAVMSWVVWLKRRHDAMYGWYALGAFCWAIYIQYFFAKNIPVSAHTWMWLTFSAGYFMAIAMMLFCRSYMQMACRWCARVFISLGFVLSLLLFTTPLPSMFSVIGISFAILMILIFYLFAHLMVYTFRQRNAETLLLGISVGFNVVFGVHDLMSLVLAWSPPHYLLHYGSALMMAAMGLILLNRFVAGMRLSEQMNVILNQQLKQKERELLAMHQEIRKVQMRETVMRERERLMEDLHDGMGGKMHAAIALADDPQQVPAVRQLLQDSLFDLRLIVDSLEYTEADLLTLLGSLRMRLQPYFDAAGVQLRWQCADRSSVYASDVEHGLQLLRIVQEALTNALRHAQASVIDLIVDFPPSVMQVTIRDNGTGFISGSTGHGLDNMRRRAARIGAGLEIVSESGKGVMIRLSYELRDCD